MSWARVLPGAVLAVLLVLLNVAVVSSELGLVHRPAQVKEGDHHRYIALAREAPGRAQAPLAREAPFCWRVLVPALVFVLTRAGCPLHLAFYASSQIFLFLFLLTLYVYLGRLGFGTAPALLGIALVGLLPGAVRWYAYQYWMTDPLALFLLALAFLLIHEGRHRALGVVALLGVLTREGSLILAPYAFLVWLRQGTPARAALRALCVFALPLAAHGALRALIVPAAGGDLLDTARDVLALRWRLLVENQLYLLTLGSWGVLLPLVLLRPRRLWASWRQHAGELAVVALAYASLMLANNTDRLLAYALPAVVPVALPAVEGLARGARAPWGAVAAVVVLLQALVYWKTPFLGNAVSIFQPAQPAVVVALVVFGLAGAALVRRQPAVAAQ